MTTPEQRQRASLAVRARMNDLNLTVRELAARAGLDRTTILALLDGSRWPRPSTRLRITNALDWPVGEISSRATYRPELREFATTEILAELGRRVVGDRLRETAR